MMSATFESNSSRSSVLPVAAVTSSRKSSSSDRSRKRTADLRVACMDSFRLNDAQAAEAHGFRNVGKSKTVVQFVGTIVMEKRKARSLALCLVLAGLAARAGAHPMGNSSVNHYARIAPDAQGVEILYVLDLAETPTAELLREWNLPEGASPGQHSQIERHASSQAQEWIRNLAIASNGRSVEPRLESSEVTMAEGEGGKQVMRVAMRLRLPVFAGKLEYEDRNYAGRPGWKEIVIAAGSGAALESATPQNQDRSQTLTAYPQGMILAPPQNLRASLEWTIAGPRVEGTQRPAALPLVPIEQPDAGPVIRADFLSQLLHTREIGMGMVLIGLAVAFALGAIHALSPGHGKTIVAAYLVGTRGTVKHAIFLGGMVTFTHTISVFFLGFTTLFLSQYVLPEKIS